MERLEVPSIVVDRRLRPHIGPRERRRAERRTLRVEVIEERRSSERRSPRLGESRPEISLNALDSSRGSDALR